MLKFTIPAATYRSIDTAIRALQNLRDGLSNRSLPLSRIKTYMVGAWNTNFTSGGGMYGDWDELEQDWTVLDRIDLGYSGETPILVRDGTLRDHFSGQANDGEVSIDALQWNFFSVPGAWLMTHHFGMPNPLPDRDPIPPRPIFGINDEQEEHMVDVMEEWVDRIIARYYS